MKTTIGLTLALLLRSGLPVFAQAQPEAPSPDAHYHLGPDSFEEEGVPKGEIRGPFNLPSQAYPGTSHTYWVYVPAQYDPSIPASLMIFNDGQAFMAPQGDLRAQNVMDNLIYRREIPVMIGVFINPGRRPEQPEPNAREWGDKTTNRPTEYNTLDDKYARVVVDELLPVLYKDYNISRDPESRGIGGASSGAIAAFTVAWQRPDQFRKVLSIVGSFTNIRGGNAYPDIIRKADKKPIRIFLQDGRNDNRSLKSDGTYDEGRDWFFQNVRMMKALTEKGYEVNYTWGMNRHGSKMGGPVMPEMMRWLWRDQPVKTDPRDTVERAFREPVQKKDQSAFIGRWDFNITTPTGLRASWLGVTQKDSGLEIWYQPTGGNVYKVKEFKAEGTHLHLSLGSSTWDLDAAGGKLTGVQKHGDSTIQLTGEPAPKLARNPPAGWSSPEPLFNGKDLDGWEPIGDAAQSHWIVKDGLLVNEAHGANLRSMRQFDDFKVHFEVNCPDDANSGFYLRGRYEVQLEYEPLTSNPVERRIGSVYGRIAPQGDLQRTPGQWETFDITLVGRTVTVVRNGVTTIDHQEIEGITGGALDANEGEMGSFYIQGDHTGGLKFRNITVSIPKR